MESSRGRLSGLDAPEMAIFEGRYARVAMDSIFENGLISSVLEGRKSYKREVANTAGNLAQQMIATGYGMEYRNYSKQHRKVEATVAAERRGPFWNKETCY